MDYKINGNDLPLLPTDGGWQQRRVLGTDGNNLAIYEPTYSYMISWDFLTYEEFEVIYDYWFAISASGSVSIALPPRKGAAYTPFTTYTGCVLDEPVHDKFYQGYYPSVRLQVRNIVI